MILHLTNGKTTPVKVTKQGRKYTYIKSTTAWGTEYRVNKETGEVEVAPYWNKIPKMYVTD